MECELETHEDIVRVGRYQPKSSEWFAVRYKYGTSDDDSLYFWEKNTNECRWTKPSGFVLPEESDDEQESNTGETEQNAEVYSRDQIWNDNVQVDATALRRRRHRQNTQASRGKADDKASPQSPKRRRSSLNSERDQVGGDDTRDADMREISGNLSGEEMAQVARRKAALTLFIENAQERLDMGFVLCEWGCCEWLEPDFAAEHQKTVCPKRVQACSLGCGLRVSLSLLGFFLCLSFASSFVSA